jgi:hypothetical protein
MAGLVDLFNPTFLMFLGILVLVVAVLVAYFESKLRDQNHKIASMLSLVSTLAEDMNGVKMGLNQLAEFNRTIGGNPPSNLTQPLETKTVPFNPENTLIEVSDDDYEDDDDDDDDEDDEDDEDDDDDDEYQDEDFNDSSDDDDGHLTISADVDLGIVDSNDYADIDEDTASSNDDLKVFTLNLTQETEKHNNSVTKLQLNEIKKETGTELEPFMTDDANLNNENETNNDQTFNDISNNVFDLKSIHANLEETNIDHSDYKKLSLPKLRSIVTEKGLAQDASKLKKNELIKLLE